jgi:hypothetical protein
MVFIYPLVQTEPRMEQFMDTEYVFPAVTYLIVNYASGRHESVERCLVGAKDALGNRAHRAVEIGFPIPVL